MTDMINKKDLEKIKMKTLQKWLAIRKGIFVSAKKKSDVIDSMIGINFGYDETIELKLLADMGL